jgi:hypothetical protein
MQMAGHRAALRGQDREGKHAVPAARLRPPHKRKAPAGLFLIADYLARGRWQAVSAIAGLLHLFAPHVNAAAQGHGYFGSAEKNRLVPALGTGLHGFSGRSHRRHVIAVPRRLCCLPDYWDDIRHIDPTGQGRIEPSLPPCRSTVLRQ